MLNFIAFPQLLSFFLTMIYDVKNHDTREKGVVLVYIIMLLGIKHERNAFYVNTKSREIQYFVITLMWHFLTCDILFISSAVLNSYGCFIEYLHLCNFLVYQVIFIPFWASQIFHTQRYLKHRIFCCFWLS